MSKECTELVFVLDRSGSMRGMESDTIGGFNAMLAKQRAISGECRITTVLFNHQDELLHDRIDLNAVADMTAGEYFVGGTTALLDALGHAIQRADKVQQHTAAGCRADKVLFVIITDGMENASREFSLDRVRALVSQRREQGWEFVFLGANIDAAETAARYGMDRTRAATYEGDAAGTRLNYDMMSHTVAAFRESRQIPQEALENIRRDRRSRQSET